MSSIAHWSKNRKNVFYEDISKIQVIQSIGSRISQQKLFYRRALLNNHRSEKGPPP